MKSIFALLLLNLAAAVAMGAPNGIKAPFYKIEKNGQTAYLLGTIHTGINFSALSDTIINTANTSDSLVVETDISKGAAIAATAFPMGAKDSLKNQLTPDEWDRFSATVGPILGPQANFVMDLLHPVTATSMYGAASLPPTKEPIDQFLVQTYEQANKPIYFFEDIQVQIDAIAGTQTIDTLKQQLALDPSVFESQNDALVNIYSSGDLNLINMFLVQPMPADQLQVLLIDRNLAWMDIFDDIFNQPGQEFMAVGAAHLAGNYGMVKLLADIGYTVTKIDK